MKTLFYQIAANNPELGTTGTAIILGCVILAGLFFCGGVVYYLIRLNKKK